MAFRGRRTISRYLAEIGWEPETTIATRTVGHSGPIDMFRVGGDEELAPLDADKSIPLHAMVVGVDPIPRPLTRDEITEFGDYFTANLLLRGSNPLTLRELVTALQDVNPPNRLSIREMFLAAEGAPFATTNPDADVNARVVYVWRKNSNTPPDIMLSTVPAPDDPTALLQLIAWSESDGAFHFFEREEHGLWIWAGNSFHALEGPSRGQGPFDSHINGSLVMKELKRPWVHWHSEADTIDRSVVFDASVGDDPLFTGLVQGEQLEKIVRQGIARWTTRRLTTDTVDGRVQRLETYVRQLVATTSINLISAKTTRAGLATAASLRLPGSFFLDVDGIAAAIGTDPLPMPAVTVEAATYARARDQLGFEVVDPDGTRLAEDTHFVFTVPERAFEDVAVAEELIARDVLSRRLALAIALVDFPNPVFSARRPLLAGLFPPTAPAGASADLDDVVLAAAAASDEPVAGELLRAWEDAADPTAVIERLKAYIEAVSARLQTEDGVTDLLRLAESRTRCFRSRKLAEFSHTVARQTAVVADRAMTFDGSTVDVDDNLRKIRCQQI